MTSPTAQRTAGRSGYVAKGGTVALREMFLPVASAAEFAKWSEDRTTSLVRDALRDMALNGPLSVDAHDAAVQYGVTVGLNLAVQLMTDPSLVYPELFTGVAASALKPLGQPDYATGAGSLLDNR